MRICLSDVYLCLIAKVYCPPPNHEEYKSTSLPVLPKILMVELTGERHGIALWWILHRYVQFAETLLKGITLLGESLVIKPFTLGHTTDSRIDKQCPTMSIKGLNETVPRPTRIIIDPANIIDPQCEDSAGVAFIICFLLR